MGLRELHERLIQRFGPVINLRENPEVLLDIHQELGSPQAGVSGSSAPFGVSWMDSWVAHWIYTENLQRAETHDKELARVLRGLLDLKFNERLDEIRRFIGRPTFEPPDGGPPDGPPAPGPPPPAGPAPIKVAEPPDGGPPEPGAPPGGPARFGVDEPPDGGPPEPGTPPTGPDSGFLRENPWILYWFISIKAPVLLDVIDAHLTRRLNELRGQGAA